MSVQFEGEHNAQYVATAAYSGSPVDEKSKVLLFMSKSPAKQSSNNKDCQVKKTPPQKTAVQSRIPLSISV